MGSSGRRQNKNDKRPAVTPRGRKRLRTTGPKQSLGRAAALVAVVLVMSAGLLVAVRPGLIAGPDVRATPSIDPSPIIRTALHTDFTVEPKTLAELTRIPRQDLGKIDIARMNLLCAKGMPGAEGLDIEHALATLDQWAEHVAAETDRHLHRVTDPRYAEHYRHSEAYFRAESLLQVLQEAFGVKYDPKAINNFSFADSRVAFIHGMIPAPGKTVADTTGGTCASMPVLYVAVGRRLGYPLKLVTTNSHVFVRWDGENHRNPSFRETFNIDGAGEGFSSYPDDHYRNWPYKVTPKQEQVNGYLVTLEPHEELAQFLAARGHCAFDHGRNVFAARCYENASLLDWPRPCYRSWFMDAAMRCDYQPESASLQSLLAAHSQVERRRYDAATPIPIRTQTGPAARPGAIPAMPFGQPNATATWPAHASVIPQHPAGLVSPAPPHLPNENDDPHPPR